ncbi:glycosyl hydrolase family 18 protein [Brevibacillus sp. NRS-1366]|uniref:glycosyl hydrolase family 18 protein n=1 Tax=Brevibacillus sp. NRS-1366 TaxID=3233899 RepID=UPI003D1DB556
MDRIVMGWNAFGTTDTYIEQNSAFPNLNVVCPRWFSLQPQQFVTGEVDPRYVEWAHDTGKQVWAFFGNKFDPELTDQVLHEKKNHEKIARLLETKLVKNKVDGINIDFENMKMENKQDFVSFVRELKKVLSPHGIIVSVDVTRENPDPFWSGSYDRAELGNIADYVIMMGYDEDLGVGEKVGSVASLSWVEEGIQLLMKDVPSSKIILAVPFYTREWVTNLKTKEATRNDRTMIEVEEILKNKGLHKKWDDKARQNYVEFVENDEKHQIWIEDEKSLQERLDIVSKYKLRGTAAWFIGQETPDIWPVFHARP